jgi:hypothetical protein
MASEKPLPHPGAATFLALFSQTFFGWESQLSQELTVKAPSGYSQ